MRARGEGGQTLFESITVVLLLGLVLGVVYQGIGSLTRAIDGVDRRLQNLDEARVLMAVVSKDLRTATRLQAGTPAFAVAADREVVFYANLNNPAGGGVADSGPRRVRIFVDAQDQLIEEVTRPDAGSVPPAYTYTGPATRRFVGRYVANPAGRPIFRYLDANGNALGPTPLDADARLAVRAVRITLSIRRATSLPVAHTTLVNTVRLPNLDYQEAIGG
jgi:hypothetical protein